jgi:hypothetical protein
MFTNTYKVTSHLGVMGIKWEKWQFVYRESEYLCTFAVTRHVEVTGVMWPFVYQLSCLVQIAAQID